MEREQALGGRVGRFGEMYPHGKNGRELVATLVAEVKRRPAITVLTGAEMVAKSGSFGNYLVDVRVGGPGAGSIQVLVGSIVVATGFDTYQPEVGELGYGIDGVLTLPELKELLDGASVPLAYRGRPVRSIAYVYCVGSRQPADGNGANEYCSRYCCTAAVHASVLVSRLDPAVRQFHLYRDMRTYGKYETLYTESRKAGSVYLRFPDDEPPAVAVGTDGGLVVTVRDLLTGGGAGDPGGPPRAGHGHGPAEERGAGRDAQASPGERWLLQRDPPQAAPGRDGRRRRPDRGDLPGAEELRRERGVGPGRRDPERRRPAQGLRRAGSARRSRGR